MTDRRKSKNKDQETLESLQRDLDDDREELESVKREALRRIARLELQLQLLRESKRWTPGNR